MPEEALQIAETRHERQRRKGKIHPSECIVPMNNKEKLDSLLSDQCKEIEENKMRKMRSLKEN